MTTWGAANRTLRDLQDAGWEVEEVTFTEEKPESDKAQVGIKLVRQGQPAAERALCSECPGPGHSLNGVILDCEQCEDGDGGGPDHA